MTLKSPHTVAQADPQSKRLDTEMKSVCDPLSGPRRTHIPGTLTCTALGHHGPCHGQISPLPGVCVVGPGTGREKSLAGKAGGHTPLLPGAGTTSLCLPRMVTLRPGPGPAPNPSSLLRAIMRAVHPSSWLEGLLPRGKCGPLADTLLGKYPPGKMQDLEAF